MKKYRFIFIGLLLIAQNLFAQSNTDTLKILFVGNSYTYFWNMPQIVQAMAADDGLNIITRKSTAGGTNWQQHWEGDKGLKSKELIASGGWDYVVIQNHSRSSIERPKEFMEYGNKLIKWIKDHGATPVLYQTWARSFNPMMLPDIKSAYDKLAKANQLEVVQVGEIWEYTLQNRPEIELYHPDGSHPSPTGAYLTACAFYHYFTQNDLSQVKERISTVDKDGELLYLSILMEGDAAFLKQSVISFTKQQADE